MARITSISPLLTDFWDWWVSGLRDLVPDTIKQRFYHERDRVFIQIQGRAGKFTHVNLQKSALVDTVHCPLQARHSSERATAIAWLQRVCRSQAQPVLSLPETDFISKTIVLPAAAEENLREVISFEMDRQTPFKAEQVYFGYTVVDRDETEERLRVKLNIAPRDKVDSVLQYVKVWGIDPEAAVFTDSSDDYAAPKAEIPLSSNGGRARPLVKATSFLLVLITALLVMAAIMIPLHQKRQTITRLEQRIEQVRPDAVKAAQMRTEFDRITKGANYLVDRRGEMPLIAQALNELARIIPDNAWLSRLELADNQLTMQGEASVATILIEGLESSDRFASAKFTSTIRQNSRTGKEQFNLSTQIVGN